VYDANGQVDAAASRRVAFKFRLTDEQMIEQMQSILESADGTGN
jgi:chemotaxis protein MotB